MIFSLRKETNMIITIDNVKLELNDVIMKKHEEASGEIIGSNIYTMNVKAAIEAEYNCDEIEVAINNYGIENVQNVINNHFKNELYVVYGEKID